MLLEVNKLVIVQLDNNRKTAQDILRCTNLEKTLFTLSHRYESLEWKGRINVLDIL